MLRILTIIYTVCTAQITYKCQEDYDCRMGVICQQEQSICIVQCRVDGACKEITITGPTDGILVVECGDARYGTDQICDGVTIMAQESKLVNITAGDVVNVLSAAQIYGPLNTVYTSTLDCGSSYKTYQDQCKNIQHITSYGTVCVWDIKYPQGFAEEIFLNVPYTCTYIGDPGDSCQLGWTDPFIRINCIDTAHTCYCRPTREPTSAPSASTPSPVTYTLFDCDAHNPVVCNGAILNCEANIDCVIICSNEDNLCEGTQIIGPIDAVLNVTCGTSINTGIQLICQGMTIDATYSKEVNIHSAGTSPFALKGVTIDGPEELTNIVTIDCGTGETGNCWDITMRSKHPTCQWRFICLRLDCFIGGGGLGGFHCGVDQCIVAWYPLPIARFDCEPQTSLCYWNTPSPTSSPTSVTASPTSVTASPTSITVSPTSNTPGPTSVTPGPTSVTPAPISTPSPTTKSPITTAPTTTAPTTTAPITKSPTTKSPTTKIPTTTAPTTKSPTTAAPTTTAPTSKSPTTAAPTTKSPTTTAPITTAPTTAAPTTTSPTTPAPTSKSPTTKTPTTKSPTTKLPTAVPTKQPTPAPTSQPTSFPTNNTPSPTDTTSNPSRSTSNPSSVPTRSPTINPTIKPSQSPITPGNPTQSPTNPTNYPSQNPTINPTPSPTANPTNDPTPSPTNNPIPVPTTNPTPSPTLNPTPSPTTNPTPSPTTNPTPSPTTNPTPSPTTNPTLSPTSNPTPSPTDMPLSVGQTAKPTPNPTPSPTDIPTDITNDPTPSPTTNPTASPTNQPSPAPSNNPTSSPTNIPLSMYQTANPIPSPTDLPTPLPTNIPSIPPTNIPSSSPTKPTISPTFKSISTPTSKPSINPSKMTSTVATSSKSTTTTKPAVVYETDIVFIMGCVSNANNNGITTEIESVLTNLIETQYPESEIDSITVQQTDDGKCKYIITTKIISEIEEDAYRLQAYANNEQDKDGKNGLSTDFANGLEAEVPDIGDVDVELAEPATVTERRNEEANISKDDILSTEFIIIIAIVGALCICCALILFFCYKEKAKKDILEKKLEMEKLKIQQMHITKATVSYDLDYEELKKNNVNLKNNTGNQQIPPSLKELPRLPPEYNNNNNNNNNNTLIPALPSNVTPGMDTNTDINTGDDSDGDIGEGVPIPPPPPAPINGSEIALPPQPRVVSNNNITPEGINESDELPKHGVHYADVEDLYVEMKEDEIAMNTTNNNGDDGDDGLDDMYGNDINNGINDGYIQINTPNTPNSPDSDVLKQIAIPGGTHNNISTGFPYVD